MTGLVDRFKVELGGNSKVIGTGGLATTISQEADVFDDINQDLTLIGLRLIYNMNKSNDRH